MENKAKTPIRLKRDLIRENLARINFQNGNPSKPMFHTDDSVFEGQCIPWQDALVVKLLGKTIGYNILKANSRGYGNSRWVLI